MVSGMVSRVGIAAGRLEDGHAGLQGTALLGVPHHGGADPALDRVGGIASFDLAEDFCAAAGVEPIDADQRRAADGFRIVIEYWHGAPYARGLLAIFLLSAAEKP
jgi:hypothetical protein